MQTLPYPLVQTLLTTAAEDLYALHMPIPVETIRATTAPSQAAYRATAHNRCGIKGLCGFHHLPRFPAGGVYIRPDTNEVLRIPVAKS